MEEKHHLRTFLFRKEFPGCPWNNFYLEIPLTDMFFTR